MLDQLWSNATARPWIIGPDENPDGVWLHDFLQASDGVVRAVTYHQYSGFGGDTNLSAEMMTPTYWHNPIHTLIWNGTNAEPPIKPHSAPSIQQAFGAYQNNVTLAELWVGETAAAWDSGKLGTTNAFVDSFWFISQLGSLAQAGVATQCRQTLVGGAYELLDKHTFQPNPDYYVALLWHRLMGRRVLGITQPTEAALVRVYAHCYGNDDNEQYAGSISVVAMNADASRETQIDLKGVRSLVPRQEYRLTAGESDKVGSLHSQTVNLNGQPLIMTEDGILPSVTPVAVTNASTPLRVQPLEVVFMVLLGANAATCS